MSQYIYTTPNRNKYRQMSFKIFSFKIPVYTDTTEQNVLYYICSTKVGYEPDLMDIVTVHLPPPDLNTETKSALKCNCIRHLHRQNLLIVAATIFYITNGNSLKGRKLFVMHPLIFPQYWGFMRLKIKPLVKRIEQKLG